MTTKTETTWIRYRHREGLTLLNDRGNPHENPGTIEYEVECEPLQTTEGEAKILKCYDGFFKIRTVRNLYLERKDFKEERHQPAFTYMPADKFLSLYERVG